MAADSPRSVRRLALGAAAVLTRQQAAELLPVGDAEGARWLEARGLVRDLCGRPVVIWGEVLAELARDAAAPVHSKSKPSASPRRVSLR